MQNVILVLRKLRGQVCHFYTASSLTASLTYDKPRIANTAYPASMTRPLRLEFPGALYHVTSRGDRKASIFFDDTDRLMWLQTLGEVCAHFNFSVHAFCQMTNHYHLLIETRDGKLAKGMRQLNSVYAQYFNRRHALVGHVFQGRYKAILVDKESYLLEVARYIVLNPVRAGLVRLPDEWRWSSFLLTSKLLPPPDWLDVSRLLSKFGGPGLAAQDAYRHFVLAGIGGASPMVNTHRQLILGSEQFIQQLQASTISNQGAPRIQRSALALSLLAYQEKFHDRDVAMAEAYRTSAYTLSEIARHFGVSLATASRAARKYPAQR